MADELQVLHEPVRRAAASEGLEAFQRSRAESTDGVLRTTAISPGYVRTGLAGSTSDPVIQEQISSRMDAIGIPAEAVARTIAFAIEQPADVEIGEITIRPTRQG